MENRPRTVRIGDISGTRIYLDVSCYPLQDSQLNVLIENPKISGLPKDFFLIGATILLKEIVIGILIIIKACTDKTQIDKFVKLIDIWEVGVMLLAFLLAFGFWFGLKHHKTDRDRLIEEIRNHIRNEHN